MTTPVQDKPIAPRIVEATGTATRNKGPTSKMIEAAMSQAVRDCAEAGITDPAEIREAMLEARQRVKGQVAKEKENAGE